MEVVTLRFQEDILKKIDESLTINNFNSRTEFIREAVRDKLNELDRDKLIEELMKFRGKSKVKTTREENRKTRAQVSKQLLEELEKKFT